MQLIPMCIDDKVTKVSANFNRVNMTKATPDVFDSVASAVCKAVVAWLTDKEVETDVERILRPDKVGIYGLCIDRSIRYKSGYFHEGAIFVHFANQYLTVNLPLAKIHFIHHPLHQREQLTIRI